MLTLMLALLVAVMPASTEPVPVTPSGDQYAETWAWCADRFPGQPDLTEACQWGAFDMIYQTPTEEWSA